MSAACENGRWDGCDSLPLKLFEVRSAHGSSPATVIMFVIHTCSFIAEYLIKQISLSGIFFLKKHPFRETQSWTWLLLRTSSGSGSARPAAIRLRRSACVNTRASLPKPSSSKRSKLIIALS